MRLLLCAALLAGCAERLTAHNVTVTGERFPDAQIDDAVDTLALELGKAGVTADAADIIASSWLIVEWQVGDVDCPNAILAKPPEGAAWKIAGCHQGRIITLSEHPCIADTALAHEFAHVVLEWVTAPTPTFGSGRKITMAGDSDPYHTRNEVWLFPSGAVAQANAQLRQRWCKG